MDQLRPEPDSDSTSPGQVGPYGGDDDGDDMTSDMLQAGGDGYLVAEFAGQGEDLHARLGALCEISLLKRFPGAGEGRFP